MAIQTYVKFESALMVTILSCTFISGLHNNLSLVLLWLRVLRVWLVVFGAIKHPLNGLLVAYRMYESVHFLKINLLRSSRFAHGEGVLYNVQNLDKPSKQDTSRI